MKNLILMNRNDSFNLDKLTILSESQRSSFIYVYRSVSTNNYNLREFKIDKILEILYFYL